MVHKLGDSPGIHEHNQTYYVCPTPSLSLSLSTYFVIEVTLNDNKNQSYTMVKQYLASDTQPLFIHLICASRF